MLQVEARLGCTLEEDYRQHYLEKGLGQKRLADRWRVTRNTVFESSVRSRSRSWVEMLGLPVRRIEEDEPAPLPRVRRACEACAENSVSLERAHWIEASKGEMRVRFQLFAGQGDSTQVKRKKHEVHKRSRPSINGMPHLRHSCVRLNLTDFSRSRRPSCLSAANLPNPDG